MNRDFCRRLFLTFPDALYVCDRHGTILQANETAETRTGYSRNTLRGMHFGDVVPLQESQAFEHVLDELGRDGKGAAQVVTAQHRGADGVSVPVKVSLTLIQTEPEPLFAAVVQDNGDRNHLEAKQRERDSFDRLLLNISVRLAHIEPEYLDEVIHEALADIAGYFETERSSLFSIDDNACTFSNTYEWNAAGLTPAIDSLQDQPTGAFPWLMEHILEHRTVDVPAVAALPDEAAEERKAYVQQGIGSLIVAPIVQGEVVTGMFGLYAVRDRSYWSDELRNNVRLLGQLLANAVEAVNMAILVRRLAYHDPLTGLANRELLGDRIEQEAARITRSGGHLAVMLIDIDDFKLINDSLGHHSGDALLCGAADRLRQLIRTSDTAARIGGDEFALVAQVNGADDAAALAKRTLDDISRPMVIMEQSIIAHPSIGISLFPDDNRDSQSLLANAELAMYAAKAGGKNRFAFFDSSMTERARNILHLRHELSQGLRAGQLLLHFQPRIDLRNATVCGIEALVRWDHPGRGPLSPADFLPVAERSELICMIDHWVLEEACRSMNALPSGFEVVRIAVNLSARDLYDGEHADQLLEKLSQHYGNGGIPLEIEITESILMQDIDAAIRQLHRIKEVVPDVHIAIDDFGSGYSSLNYLRLLPINTLKIDQSFVRDLKDANSSAEAIIRSVIELARNLNLRVVAEGIETEFQARILAELGCDEAQGYFFARPLALKQLADAVDADLHLKAAG